MSLTRPVLFHEHTYSASQDWQISLKLVVGYLATVLVPFDLLILDEGIKYVVAEGPSDQFALFRELDCFPKVAG